MMHLLSLCLPLLQFLEYPGRPALSTLDNNTPNPKPGLLEYIPAVQTRPFDITSTDNTTSCLDSSSSGSGEQQQRSGGGCDSSGSGSSSAGGKLGLSACWEEQLCVDAAPEELVQSDAVLLLELLQLPGGFTRFKVRASCAACYQSEGYHFFLLCLSVKLVTIEKW
jgi:hypothetical protein